MDSELSAQIKQDRIDDTENAIDLFIPKRCQQGKSFYIPVVKFRTALMRDHGWMSQKSISQCMLNNGYIRERIYCDGKQYSCWVGLKLYGSAPKSPTIFFNGRSQEELEVRRNRELDNKVAMEKERNKI